MKIKKFYAEWCGPCKGLSMVIAGAGDKITIPIENIDIDSNIMESVQYDVRSVPMLVLVDDNGKEIKRLNGMVSETQLLEFLKV
jgi:thioredoxin 1